MSGYLDRLKEVESKKILCNTPVSEVSKVPEVPFDTFGTSMQAEIEEKLFNQTGGYEEKNISFSPTYEVTKVPKASSDTFDTSTQAQIEKNILLIQSWLYQIGEPETDHYLVIDKCILDSEAMKYFLKHAAGEYETGIINDNDNDSHSRYCDAKKVHGGYEHPLKILAERLKNLVSNFQFLTTTYKATL